MDVQILLIALLLLILLKVVSNILFGPLKSLPGPWYSRFTHLVLKWHVITGNRCNYIHSLHRIYGDVIRISPGEVAVASLEDSIKIHKINSGFEKTDWYEKLTDQPRKGVFNMRDTHQHAARRKLFAQAFSKSNLRSKWEIMIHENAGMAVNKMLQEAQSQDVDILKWWTFMATDVSAALLFGDSFKMLETGHKNEYIHVLEKALMGGGIGAELPLVRWIGRKLPFRAIQLVFDASDYLLKFTESAVDNARGGKSIFSDIIAKADEGMGSMDSLDIQVEAGNLLVAGSDTTAITLTYLVWAVLSRPELRVKLEEELSELPESFHDVDLENLTLMNASIEEALRLYGAAPGSLPRMMPSNGGTLGGYLIPGGCTVSTQAWSLHRNPQIFENPDTFGPERWLSDTPNRRIASAAMSAFGKGSRTCLGIHLASMELRVGLATFLRQCRSLDLADSTTPQSMAVENFFLIAPKAHRCNLCLKERGINKS